ncbi:MAG TPA: T9SS type A sorting domain-containing protein [Chitinophagaceae bacterium]|nr:T9SS type A sorting domain-containing protein [Chitinophagaceae bacterium]
MKKFTLFITILFVTGLFLSSTVAGQISQRGTATNGTSTNTNLTINKPAGVVSGDVMIANIVKAGNTASDPSLSGWTVISGGVIDDFYWNGYDLGFGNIRGTLLYKIAGTSEPSSYTFSLGSGTDYSDGTIVAFSGVDRTGGVKVDGTPGGPFDVKPGNISLSGSNGNTATATGITTATSNAAIIMFAQANDNRSMSNWSTTSPGSLTELYENQYNGNGSNDLTVGAAWATKATIGATGNGTVTLGASIRWGAMLIALKAPSQAPLPVTLTKFSVSKSGNDALLSWTTATEINNDHFEIERSADGINFSTIGTVAGSGNSSQLINYQFTDHIWESSATIFYYRLKQVDIDGKSSYSKIIVLRLNNLAISNYTVYPNPFTSDLKLQISSQKETDIVIQIHNSAGQLEVSQKASLQTGDNIIVVQNLGALSPGLHLMKIVSLDGVVSEKLMKN